MYKKVGIDLGRRYQKGVMETDGKFIKTIIENAIATGNNQYLREFGESKNSEIENLLDVEIYEGSKLIGRKFLGSLARQYHSGDLITPCKHDHKFSEDGNDELIKVLVLTSVLSYKQNLNNIDINMGTGLPAEEYFNDIVDFSSYKNREFKIKFLHPNLNNYECNLKINRIEVAPEGTATSLNHYYNDVNQVSEKMTEDLNEGSIFFINFGSSTTDVCVVKMINGAVIYDPRGMFGLPIGGDKALNIIRKKLKEEYEIDLEKVDLEYYLRLDKDIKYQGKNIPLRKIKNDAYGNILKNIRNMFLEKVDENGINPYMFKKIIVSGGMVSDLTKEHFFNFVPGIETLVSSEPMFDEAKGYLKFLEQKIKSDEAREREIRDDSSLNDEIEIVKN